MNKEFSHQLNQFNKEIKGKQHWRRIVTALGVAVAFFTVNSLILPAITMENTVICGMEEHTHIEECYTEVTTPDYICTPSETVHIHNDLCYDSLGEIACPMEEALLHTHTDDCYNIEKALSCTLEEDYHVHENNCFMYTQGDLQCVL